MITLSSAPPFHVEDAAIRPRGSVIHAQGVLERNHRRPQSGFSSIDADVRVSDAHCEFEDLLFRQSHVVAVQVQEGAKHDDCSAFVPVPEGMICRDTPEKRRRLSGDVGVLVSRSVLWPRESRLELSGVKERVFRLLHRDLDRLRVGVERVVEVEILGGQALLSVVLGETLQDRPVTPRGVADDLPPCLPGSDGHRLENNPPGPVNPRLNKIAITEIGLREHVRRQRDDAAVANPAHMNHRHDRTSCAQLYIQWPRTVKPKPAHTAWGASRQGRSDDRAAVRKARSELRMDGTLVSSRSRLTAQEGAILEFLRERGRTSDLGSTDTIRRLLKLLREGNTFARVAAAASDEPPRVRAMLGALGEEMGANPAPIARLRHSLNPLSRFDFGLLRSLRHARDWQAK